MANTKWVFDPSHSEVTFKVKHLMISNVKGEFKNFEGLIDGEDFTNATISAKIKAESIHTNDTERDNHLRSEDFFEVEKFPEMTFKSTKILATGKPNGYLLYGKLTIKGVTKDVVFDVSYGGSVQTDQSEKLGMRAETTINRFDFNIDYDPTAAGIGKEVNIVAHLQFAKQ